MAVDDSPPEATAMRLVSLRLTVRQMMGVVVIMALLMPGVIFVLRGDEYQRWPIAIATFFFYVTTSTAILALTFPGFFPERER
jgi:hypothetical protein